VGKTVYETSPHELAEQYAQMDRELVNQPGTQAYETVAVRADGARRNVMMHRACFNDAAGNVRGIVAVALDITDRVQAEEALRESEKLYRTLIDSSDDTIHVKDRQRRYLLVNSRLTEELGRDKADIVGKKAEDLYPPEVARSITAADEHILATGVSVDMEESLPWTNGTRVMLTRKVPLHDAQGEVSGIVTISRDITERKRLEEQFLQAQKMEAVGRLAGGVAHDFNNLLTVIQGRAAFALEALGAGHEAREDLTEVLSAAQRAAILTRQLLVFSRRQVVQMRVFDLNEVLRDVTKMLVRLIGENIRLELKLADTLGNIKADAGQMEQVVMNLVVNARDAMPQGGTLTIETCPALLDATFVAQHLDAQVGPHVLLSVSDTGCGMSQEVKAHLFEPFFTTKDSGKGTGLGLATVYGIVKQSLGTIQVDSEPGQGTTFRLYLPCHDEAHEVGGAPMAVEALPRGTETILVVEDDESVRQLTVRMLRSLGYRVLEAPRVEDVLYLVSIRNEPIQLVLSDVMMPEMSGPDLALRLREEQAKRGQAVRTPVLFMTGYTNEALVALLPLGTNVLRKPFTTAQLALMVYEALHGHAREASVGDKGSV
jgi:PAS domain S-box-containing protein